MLELINYEKCKECISIHKVPSCIVNTIKNIKNIDNIFNDNYTYKENKVFICSFKAQELINNSLSIRKEKCIDCNLCIARCPYLGIEKQNIITKIYNSSLEDIIFDSPTSMSSTLNIHFNGHYYFYPEVQVSGKFRNKRIDLVGVSDSKILLIKLISDESKANFYLRSYLDIVSYLSNNFTTTKDIEIILLTKSSIDLSINGINYHSLKYNSLDTIINI